jgi:glycosyltransferase involved in cell wall biosynthesis
VKEWGQTVVSSSVAEILVILPTLGDRLESLEETLASIDNQRSTVSLRLVVIVPVVAVAARELAKNHGATIVDDPGTGISEAINVGIAVRDGEDFYAWIGDDDLFRQGGLHLLKSLLDNEPRAVLAYGGCDYIDVRGNILGRSRAGKLAQIILAWGPDLIPHPGSMIRLDDLEAVDCFDATLKYAMDLDLFLRLRPRGRFVCTKTAVSAFRWHPDSLTVAGREKSSAESEAVKARYLPLWLRPFSGFWVVPVRWASSLAARSVSTRARSFLR